MQPRANSLTGLSIADTSNPITTYHQIGGKGTVFNTVLAVPSHLNASSPTSGDAPWNSLEHVVISPLAPSSDEPASVGEHVQATDELYYIHRGNGRLVTNGQPAAVRAGTLVIAPKGTCHSIENPSPDTHLEFLVIELHAPVGSASHQATVVEDLPLLPPVGLQAMQDGEPVPFRATGLDLASTFAAPFGLLTAFELPPGAAIAGYTLPTQDENLFVSAGLATIFVADVRIDPPENGGLRNVVVPWGVPRRIVNTGRGPLSVLSVRVHRQVAGLTRSLVDEEAGSVAALK